MTDLLTFLRGLSPSEFARAASGEDGENLCNWIIANLANKATPAAPASGVDLDALDAEMFPDGHEWLDAHERKAIMQHGVDALAAELRASRAEVEALRKAGRNIMPYLRFTIGPESPGHHPTMPSAVDAFEAALEGAAA